MGDLRSGTPDGQYLPGPLGLVRVDAVGVEVMADGDHAVVAADEPVQVILGPHAKGLRRDVVDHALDGVHPSGVSRTLSPSLAGWPRWRPSNNLGRICSRSPASGTTARHLLLPAPGISSIEVDHVDDALRRALARMPAWLPHLYVPLLPGPTTCCAGSPPLRRERDLARVAGRGRPRRRAGHRRRHRGRPRRERRRLSPTLDVVEREAGRGGRVPVPPRPGTATAGTDERPRLSSGTARRPNRRWRSVRAASARGAVGERDRAPVEPARGRVARCWAM